MFWAINGGFLVIFPIMYIPVVKNIVLGRLGVGWEWGVFATCVVVYTAVVESWKALNMRFGMEYRGV